MWAAVAGTFSKSKLANDLFNFKCDPHFGSCGFFTKDSLSSNDSRKAAKGTVEGTWFEGISKEDNFPAPFSLLNLRGDVLQHMQTATTLASSCDVFFMFCDKNMFEDESYKNLLRETAENLKLKDEGEEKISKLVVVFTSAAQHKVKENRAILEDISKTVLWEKVGNNYQRFPRSINETIQNSLRESRADSLIISIARLKYKNKESKTANIKSTKNISDLFLKIMSKIKNVDENQRSALREPLFPLQSTTKHYAQTQGKENGSPDMDTKSKLSDELIAI